MLTYFDFIREMSFTAITIRLVLAVICGGLIGIEREFKHRPAGFRTHILICLGAAMTMLTSQYLYVTMDMFTDPARLGAQVIAGIGFIGAGTIIVTKRKRVKGLTTAAGLWTSAIIGLISGSGYVECAIFATVMVLFAELVLSKLEHSISRNVHDLNLYVEYAHAVCIEQIIRVLKEHYVTLNGLEVSRITVEDDKHYYCAILNVQARKNQLGSALIKEIGALDDVMNLEEL